MSDVEDEDMATAIAASMAIFQEQEARKMTMNDDRTEDEGTDAEDEFQADLRRALEASKAEFSANSINNGNRATTSRITMAAQSLSNPEPVASNPASEFLKQRVLLEKERLARNKGLFPSAAASGEARTGGRASTGNTAGGKRSYSASQSDDDDDESSRERPSKRKVGNGSAGMGSGSGAVLSGGKCEGEIFYDHELRQTANQLVEVTDKKNKVKTFRLSDIIGDKKELEFAILSSYSTDVSWLYSLFDSKTPVILVNQPRESGEAEVHNILPNWVMNMPPLRGGRGAMHVKLMLLFYKSGRLRVAIPTANFVDYDWRDIENSVWVQDFPPLTKPILGRDGAASAFSNTLQMVLMKLKVPEALQVVLLEHPNLPLKKVEELGRRWSFGKAKVKLIPSMSGKHEGWDQVLKQGHVALMKAVIDIGAHAGQMKRKEKAGTVELLTECQGSSIGQYSPQWLQEFHSSCSGISPEKWLEKTKASRASLPVPPIRIIYPSLRTVNNSILGQAGAGTMFCRMSQWNASTFPRRLFHDSSSKRGGILMHTKMILGLWRSKVNQGNTITDSMSNGKGKSTAPIIIDSDEEEEGGDDDDVKVIEPEAAGWLYVGSHNFTPSAWGNLSGTSFTPILNITNYELGVLIPLSEKPTDAEKEGTRLASWIRPPRKYNLAGGPGAADVPWCQ